MTPQRFQGFIVGVIVASVVSIGAESFKGPSHYYSSTKMRGTSESIRIGYVTGVSDTLSLVTWFLTGSKATYAEDHKVLRAWETCLEFRGRTAGALEQFAEATWTDAPAGDENVSAASLLIGKACER